MSDLRDIVIVSLLGFVTTSSSIVGAALGLYTPLSKRMLACVLAFAGGALIRGLAIELAFKGAQELHQQRFQCQRSMGVHRQRLRRRLHYLLFHLSISRPKGGRDTLPVIGAKFVGFSSLSITLIVGMFVGGIPEAAASTSVLKKTGYSPNQIFALCSTVLVAGVVAAAAGKTFIGSGSHVAIFFQAVAGGAVPALLAHAMIPESIHKGGSLIVLPAVAGFLFALWLVLAQTWSELYHSLLELRAAEPSSQAKSMRAHQRKKEPHLNSLLPHAECRVTKMSSRQTGRHALCG
jgi:zinc transporter ZupT